MHMTNILQSILPSFGLKKIDYDVMRILLCIFCAAQAHRERLCRF